MNVNQTLRSVIIALFFTLLLGACKKENDVTPSTSVVFWSKRQDLKDLKANCYVDGQLIGTLINVTSAAPACGAPGSLTTSITPGRHTLEFRIVTGQSLTVEMDIPAGECRTLELT